MRDLAGLLEAELQALTDTDRRRACPEVAGSSRTQVRIRNQPLTSFCTNDYLGLAAHPSLAAAAAQTAVRDGWGASASRLVSGDLPAHRELEAALALFLGRPGALLFPTGYQTNIGVLTTLAGRGDLIVSDALNHASLIDGARLSRADIAVYGHADASDARRQLAAPGPYRRRLLVTESLFSMDGDVAPLTALAEAAQAADAILVVDEAHALGVLGPGGRGLCAEAGVTPDVLVGTLSKAFGAAGGFAVGDRALREVLVNRARTFIYTTALPPPVAAAAGAALTLIAGSEGEARRAALAAHRAWLGAHLGAIGLLTREPQGPIVPVVLGTESRALAASASLRAQGLFVPAIRPPTVPAGSARLRITLSAAHEPADLERLVAALAKATT
jgi:8-amino-7-oxononanoate synthase